MTDLANNYERDETTGAIVATGGLDQYKAKRELAKRVISVEKEIQKSREAAVDTLNQVLQKVSNIEANMETILKHIETKWGSEKNEVLLLETKKE